MTLDDRLPASTQTEQYNYFQQHDLTLVLADDAAEVESNNRSDEGLVVPNALGHPLKCSGGNIPSPIEPTDRAAPLKETTMLIGNPFRPGEHWGSGRAYRSVLPGGQLTVSPDWDVSGPKGVMMKPVDHRPHQMGPGVGCPSEVAPGVYEVDFDSFDPHVGLVLPTWQKQRKKSPQLMKPRLTVLERETPKLFNAASFLIWSTGKHFNTLITVSAKELGFTDNAEFMKLMPVWHKEMARWMMNGTDRFRRRASRKCLPEASQQHYWISVAEHARDKGFHVHVLCVLPKGLKKAFVAKAWDWWGRRAKQVPAKAALDFECRWPTEQRTQYARHVHLLRYVLKTTADVSVLDRNGRQWSLRRAVWAKPNDCTPVLVTVPQLAGICRALNSKAQQDEGFESCFDQRDFSFIYENWEYGMWQARIEQKRMGLLLKSLVI